MLSEKLVGGRRPDVYIPGQATHAYIGLLRYSYFVPLIKPPGLPLYKLFVAEQVCNIIRLSAQTRRALRLLRVHGMVNASLQVVYRASM